MIIQKTFHVSKSITATKTRLENLGVWRRHLNSVDSTSDKNGHTWLQFEPGMGFRGNVVLKEVSSDDINQTTYRSVGGNLRLAATIEYFSVKPEVTEVSITLVYQIRSVGYRILDILTALMDRYMMRQIREIQHHFHYAEAPIANRSARQMTRGIRKFV